MCIQVHPPGCVPGCASALACFHVCVPWHARRRENGMARHGAMCTCNVAVLVLLVCRWTPLATRPPSLLTCAFSAAPAAPQVHLVMQYCDMGTLEQAIRRGEFHDAQTGQPKLVRQAGARAFQGDRGGEQRQTAIGKGARAAGRSMVDSTQAKLRLASLRSATSCSLRWRLPGAWTTCTTQTAAWCTATCRPPTCCWPQQQATSEASEPSCPTLVGGLPCRRSCRRSWMLCRPRPHPLAACCPGGYRRLAHNLHAGNLHAGPTCRPEHIACCGGHAPHQRGQGHPQASSGHGRRAYPPSCR